MFGGTCVFPTHTPYAAIQRHMRCLGEWGVGNRHSLNFKYKIIYKIKKRLLWSIAGGTLLTTPDRPMCKDGRAPAGRARGASHRGHLTANILVPGRFWGNLDGREARRVLHISE